MESMEQAPFSTDHWDDPGGGEVVDPPSKSAWPMNTKRFGESGPGSLRIPVVARSFNLVATSKGERFGSAANSNAATPATCGAAIDVPLIVALASSDEKPTDGMELPGAKISTHEP
jgi:hypothetical protein